MSFVSESKESCKIKAYLCETFSSDLDSRSNRYGNYYNDIVTVIVTPDRRSDELLT